jgi:SAM-dependent methyltransferase
VGALQVPPYSSFAVAYDPLLGRSNFRHLQRVFETLGCRNRLRFRSAADVGTGTGLFACYLSRRWGIPVFAVDNAPAMLRVAARLCAGLPVVPLCQDLRRLRLPYPVDLVTANSDVLNHLISAADLRAALRRIHENLRSDGHLVFDFVTPCEPLGGFRRFERSVSGGGRVAVQRIRWDPKRRRLAGRVLVGARNGRWMEERHEERAYTPAEMRAAVSEVGFRIRSVLDAATLRVSRGCAPRYVVVASAT